MQRDDTSNLFSPLLLHASISVPLTAALLSEFGRWEKPHLACHLNEAFSNGMQQHWAMLSFSVLCVIPDGSSTPGVSAWLPGQLCSDTHIPLYLA